MSINENPKSLLLTKQKNNNIFIREEYCQVNFFVKLYNKNTWIDIEICLLVCLELQNAILWQSKTDKSSKLSKMRWYQSTVNHAIFLNQERF